MRVFFCAVPALLVGALWCLVHPVAGAIVAACVFGLGWDVTRIRPERGEYPIPPDTTKEQL